MAENEHPEVVKPVLSKNYNPITSILRSLNGRKGAVFGACIGAAYYVLFASIPKGTPPQVIEANTVLFIGLLKWLGSTFMVSVAVEDFAAKLKGK